MRGALHKLLFLAALTGCAAGCSGKNVESPQNRKTSPVPPVPGLSVLDVAACQADPAPTPEGLVSGEAPREVRLYLDGSASMRPFAGQGGRFHDVLVALRPVLLDLGISRSRVAKVGERVEELDHSGGFERFDRPAFYSQGETNLAAVLDELGEADATSAVTVVVTDGVTSLLRDQGKVGDLNECGRGSDVDCLTSKIGRLVKAGQGFWLVGLRSTFRGTLFSETLRVGGGSLGSVDLPDRPFYIWLITAHPPTGRALVSQLLKRLSVAVDGRQAFAVELAPGDLSWSLPGEAPATDGRLVPTGATVGAVRKGFVPAARGEAPLQKMANQDLEGTAFGLRIPLEPTALSELPEPITPLAVYRSTFCLRWIGSAPGRRPRAQAAQEKNALWLALRADSFAPLAGKKTLLVQQLVRDAAAGGVLDSLADWSTSDDSTVEAGSRTLNLENFVKSLAARLEPPDRLEQPLLRLEFE